MPDRKMILTLFLLQTINIDLYTVFKINYIKDYMEDVEYLKGVY